MKIHVEHRKISGKFSLNRTMNTVASSAGGKLLLKSLKDEASSQLSPFGIESLDFLDIGEQEILVCPDERALAAVELVHRGEQRYLQTVIIFEDNSHKDALLEFLGQIPQLEGEAVRGSVRDAIHVRRLEKILSKLSPNGQKLADPRFSTILPKLFDLKAREIVHEIYSTYSEAIVQFSILKKSEALARNPDVTNKVLGDLDLFAKKHGIGCQRCEAGYMLPLIYESKEAARAALESSEGSQCPICRASLSVGEAFSVQNIARQGVEQGLWLEYLVYLVAKEKAIAAFAGRMAGLHELDVVAALGEEVILFECKDTALGHNDPIVTAGKAQAIGASRVFTITTKNIHENVKQAVKELERPRRGFHLEQAEEAAEIQSKIASFLEDIEKNYVRQISTQREPTGFRRFLTQRPFAVWEEDFEL